MGQQLHKLLDVTIYYPQGIPTFWDYISGKVHAITVKVQVLPITEDLMGDYNDPAYKAHFQQYINQLWLNKDQQLVELDKHSQ